MSFPMAQMTATENAAADTPALLRVRFTPEMFHQLGELGLLDDETRYELIEGDIYPMTPEGAYNRVLYSLNIKPQPENR
jgi:Uma2 family endonuclease